MACCALHNYLRTKSVGYFIQNDFEEQTEENLNLVQQSLTGLQRGARKNTTNEAKKVRNEFMEYFNNEGRVAWQDYV